MVGDWNILAGRLQGDGSIDIIETELPLDISSIDRNLSAPSTMDGTIQNEVKRLKIRGRPIFEPWNTVIIAEAAGLIRGMSIYQKPDFNGSVWTLNQIGLSAYPIGMPYDGSVSFMDTDPLDIFRHIWTHLQSLPGGNLGVTVDSLSSPVRVGTPEIENDRDSGPRKLNWWESTNLGSVIDEYSAGTPFDWLEKVYWDGDRPHCHIGLGYPTIGGRKDNMRLVLGENLATEPGITEADYVNQVQVRGAGEGRDRIRGYAGIADGRLRRVRTVDDKGIANVQVANQRASRELNSTRGQLMVDVLEVFNHPNAPLEAIELGDELPLYAETDWATVDDFVRVVGKSESPQRSDVATLTVVRTMPA